MNGDQNPVYFVGAGPGDPDLITVRGARLLESAEVLIYAGSLVNPALVERSGAAVKADSMGMELSEIVGMIALHHAEGRRVVRLHSGDPSLYGAIIEQINMLSDRGIPAEIVPGVSSMFAASAALKIQLTLGGVSDTLIVTRPAGRTLAEDDIPALSSHNATMVFFLGSGHIKEITERLSVPPATPAAIVYKASWPDQKIIHGTVQDIARKAEAEGIGRSALLVVGGVLDPAGSGHRRSYLYS